MPRGRRTHDVKILEMALVGFETEKQELAGRIRDIHAQLKGTQVPSVSKTPKKAGGKRVLSAAARARIAAAQRKRWAEFHKRSAKN